MSESLSHKREEFSKKKFKQTVADLLTLLRHAADQETVALYWINRFRGQYVLERFSSRQKNTSFVDRIDFGSYFLDGFRDISEPVKLEIGRDIDQSEIAHYHGEIPAKHVILVPFVNNGETIAVTLLETKFNTFSEEENHALKAYGSALANVLHTYTELTDLSEDESEWAQYERLLQNLEYQKTDIARIQLVQDALMRDLTQGSVTFLVRSLSGWTVLSNHEASKHPVLPGTALHRSTLGYEAITVGAPAFSTHSQGNPRRISPFEPAPEGASMAIPMMLADRRMGLWVLHDTNPMSFKESNRHKWSNLIRLLAYLLVQFRPKQDIEEFFNQKFGLLNNEAMQFSLAGILKQPVSSRQPVYFGLATFADLPGLRTRLSVESLAELQAESLRRLDATAQGMAGLLGFHADYVFSFILSSGKPKTFEVWRDKVEFDFRKPFELSSGDRPIVKLNLVVSPLDGKYSEPYEVINEVKQQLNNLLRAQKLTLNKS